MAFTYTRRPSKWLGDMQIPLHWWDGAQSRNQAAGKAAVEGTPRDSIISSVTELGTSQASAKWMMIFQGEWIDEQVMILSCLGMWLVMWLGFPGHTGKGFAPNGEMHCALQCFMRGQGSLNLSWNIYEYEPFKSRHEDAGEEEQRSLCSWGQVWRS